MVACQEGGMGSLANTPLSHSYWRPSRGSGAHRRGGEAGRAALPGATALWHTTACACGRNPSAFWLANLLDLLGGEVHDCMTVSFIAQLARSTPSSKLIRSALLGGESA